MPIAELSAYITPDVYGIPYSSQREGKYEVPFGWLGGYITPAV